MHCASCEKIIAMELGDLPGVSHLQTSWTEGAGELDLDVSKNQDQDVIEAIKRAGYKAEIIDGDMPTNPGGLENYRPVIKSTPSGQPLKIKLETNDNSSPSFNIFRIR